VTAAAAAVRGWQGRFVHLCPAAFEVAVAGADCILSWLDFVAIHSNAHAAACFPPFSASLAEDAVQTFHFCLTFDLLGARHHQRTNTRGHFPIFEKAAASRKSDSLPFVQLPMKTHLPDARSASGRGPVPCNATLFHGQFSGLHPKTSLGLDAPGNRHAHARVVP